MNQIVEKLATLVANARFEANYLKIDVLDTPAARLLSNELEEIFENFEDVNMNLQSFLYHSREIFNDTDDLVFKIHKICHALEIAHYKSGRDGWTRYYVEITDDIDAIASYLCDDRFQLHQTVPGYICFSLKYNVISV